MARDTQNSNSNYLVRSSPIFTAAPFTIAVWIYCRDPSTSNYIWTIRKTDNTNYWRFYISTTGSLFTFQVQDGGGSNLCQSISPAANTWYRVVCVEGGATDHRIYTNGGNKGASVGSRSPAGVNEMTLGAYSGNPAFQGLLGPVTMWPYALTDQEVADDYRGVMVGQSTRIDYDMNGRGSFPETDLNRTYPFTVTGTLLTDFGAPAGIPNMEDESTQTGRSRVYAIEGTVTGVSKASLISWCNSQGTAVSPPPPPPPTPTAQILWGDSRLINIQSADRLFSAHNPNLRMIGGATTVNSFPFASINESNGLADSTGRVVFKKVSADPANEGVTRNWFQLQISNNCERYNPSRPTDDSIRISCGGEPYGTSIQPGVDTWMMISFVLHDSLYVDMAAPNIGDTSMSAIHQYYYPNSTLTPMTMMADPINSSGITLKWRIRRYNPASQLNPTTPPRSLETDKIILSQATAFKRYTLITHYRLGWLAQHNPIHEAFLQINGAWVNNGNPIYTYDGSYQNLSDRAVGFNLSPFSHQTRTLGLYSWLAETQFNVNGQMNPYAFPQNVNNIPNAGDKGWRAWYRVGLAIKGIPSQVGEADVNQYTLAALANAATI